MKRFVAEALLLVGVLVSGVVTQAESAGTASAIGPTPPPAVFYLFASAKGAVTDSNGVAQAGLSGQVLNGPVVGIAATPGNLGYWLVASDGGVFSFGDAGFYGSAGDTHLNSPVVGMAATPGGGGYWLAAADGGVFTYGAGTFYGSAGGQALLSPVVGIGVAENQGAAENGAGYALGTSGGVVLPFGNALKAESAPGASAQPVIGMALVSDPKGTRSQEAVTFLVTIVNNSTAPTDLTMYQSAADLGVPGAQSLAWISTPADPGATVTNGWSPGYGYTAAATGVLKPGVVYPPLYADNAVVPDVAGENARQADFHNGVYSFADSSISCALGTVCLDEDSTIPADDSASISVNNWENPDFGVQAMPNTVLHMTPPTTYFVTAGSYSQGQVLDTSSLANSAEIDFSAGVVSVTATYNPDGTWTVRPSPG